MKVKRIMPLLVDCAKSIAILATVGGPLLWFLALLVRILYFFWQRGVLEAKEAINLFF